MRIVDGRGVEVYPRMSTLLQRSRTVASGYDPDVRLPTGIPGLDGLLNGGVYLASATLWAGDSGTGKSLAVLQFLVAGAQAGEPGLLVAVEEPPSQVAANARVIGVDLQALVDAGTLRIWHPTSDELEIDRHLHQLRTHLLDYRPRRVSVDSLSAYAASIEGGARDLQDLLRSVIGLLKVARATSVFTLETAPGPIAPRRGALTDFSSLFDNVVRLRAVEDRDATRRAMSIVKLRATPAQHDPLPYEIAPGAGLRVLSRSVLHER
jgi:circadian clock protein KaiC